MIEISIQILVCLFVSFVVWAITTMILLDGAKIEDLKTFFLACAFTATPFALGWLIYALVHFEVVVFVQ